MTTRPPRVSVVIPAFNSAAYIGCALRSVLEQTYRDYEVIVVDDGSTDDTKTVVSGLLGPIRYLSQRNQGPAAARNAGVAAAAGELICFLDADDSWLPEKLAIQTRFMDQHPAVGLLFADAEEYDEQGVHCASLVSTSDGTGEFAAGSASIPQAFRKLLEANFIPTSTVMIRRACFDETGVFDVTLKGPEDRDMWTRIAARFPIAFVPAVLGRKRALPSSVSRDVEMTLRSRIRMWTKVRGLFPELAPRRVVNRLLAPTYVHLGFVLMRKGMWREARSFGLRGLGVARTPREWLLSVSLVLLTLLGRNGADLAFNTKRRLLSRAGDGVGR